MIMQAKITTLNDNLSVASQIAESDIGEIAAAGYRVLINNRPDGEEAGQLTSATARAKAEAAGLAYHYLPFTAATLTAADIDEFERLMAAADGPVLVHCRSGTRCYLLWAAAEMRKGAATPDMLIAQAAAQGFDITALARFAG
jgi:sulfide:quinone oxidoreductase